MRVGLLWWLIGCVGIALDLHWYGRSFARQCRMQGATKVEIIATIVLLSLLGPIAVGGVLALKFKGRS